MSITQFTCSYISYVESKKIAFVTSTFISDHYWSKIIECKTNYQFEVLFDDEYRNFSFRYHSQLFELDPPSTGLPTCNSSDYNLEF